MKWQKLLQPRARTRVAMVFWRACDTVVKAARWAVCLSPPQSLPEGWPTRYARHLHNRALPRRPWTYEIKALTRGEFGKAAGSSGMLIR